MRTLVLSAIIFLFAVTSAAQSPQGDAVVLTTLSIGNSVSTAESSDMGIGATVQTDIDLNAPATATGTISTVHLHWNGPCPQALKIKFFRRVGDQLTMTAERGPFDSPSAYITLTMTPAVAVQQGDFIGVTRLTGCGGPRTHWTGHASDGYNAYPGDVSGSVSANAQWHDPSILSIVGSGTATEVMRWSLPVAGSTIGSYGSNWKTALQLFNPSDSAISGRIVFHPASANGSSSDPSMTFDLAAKQVQMIGDVVATMGQTGLGSIDLIGRFSDPPFIAMSRVYNDGGVAGTSGFTQDAMDMDGLEPRLLAIDDDVFLVAPNDPAKTRFNVGVRTFCSGATLWAQVRTQAGVARGGQTVQKVYPAHYFVQVDGNTFTGLQLQPNDTIEIHIVKGTAAVYASTTDNVTNDSSIQFARRLSD